MKQLLTIAILIQIIFSSCQENNQVNISYQSTGAISEYILYYQGADRELQIVTIKPQSTQDVNNIGLVGEQGDIVYVSGTYKDPNSALKITIKIDGKIYKQASNEGDTIKFLTVSGVVPY